MAELIGLINIGTSILFLASLILTIYAIKKVRIKFTIALFFIICILNLLYVSSANVLEHMGYTIFFDKYEEFFELLSIPYFLLFIYSFTINKELELRKLKEIELSRALNQRDVLFRELKNKQNEVLDLNRNLEDLVEQRTMELELTQKTLIQSEKMAALGRLVIGFAHEINTPLGIILTASSFLNEKTKEFLDEKMAANEEYFLIVRDSVPLIVGNINKISQLIKSFKALSIDQTKEEIRSINIYEYFQEISVVLGSELRKKNIRIIIECNKSLNIETYSGALLQVLTILVMNAVIHAYFDGKGGEILLKAFIETKNKMSYLIIIVKDYGVGIPEKNIGQIFEPFFSTNKSDGSIGLGLNIVYNHVKDRLKGNIYCSSVLGEGTEFRVEIPFI